MKNLVSRKHHNKIPNHLTSCLIAWPILLMSLPGFPSLYSSSLLFPGFIPSLVHSLHCSPSLQVHCSLHLVHVVFSLSTQRSSPLHPYHQLSTLTYLYVGLLLLSHLLQFWSVCVSTHCMPSAQPFFPVDSIFHLLNQFPSLFGVNSVCQLPLLSSVLSRYFCFLFPIKFHYFNSLVKK